MKTGRLQNLEDRRELRLDQIGSIVSGGTPSTENPENWNGPFMWLTPADLSDLSTRHVTKSARTLTQSGFERCAGRLLPAQSLVISSRAPIGHMALPLSSFCTNQGCKSIDFFDGQDADFHYYNLRYWVKRIHDKGEGTTFAEISKTALASVQVPVPLNIEIQTAIARVLITVDRAIEQTEALLVKQQRIKAGLMHDLLTRGLDANGQLRDPAKHRFKPSRFGMIPNDWDIKPLAECTKYPITYGIVQAGPHVPGGVPYIRTGDMDGDVLVRDKLLCTSSKIAAHFKRSQVRGGEIVCAIRATIGKLLPVPLDLDGANLTQGTARIAPSDKIDSRFLLWALRAHKTQQEISLQSKGTTFAEIILADLRCTPVAVARSRDEQSQIGKMIDQADSEIGRMRVGLDKLRHLKSGLMQDLLTGRVPVTPLLKGKHG